MKKQHKTNSNVKNHTIPFFIFLFVALFSPVKSFTQNTVTLNLKNVSLVEFFNEIEKNNGIRFSYVDHQLDSKKDISIQTTNEPIDQVLNKVLLPKGYEYTRTGSTYAVTKKITKPAVIRKYSGFVTDDKGTPVIGATVKVDGTNIGTITDVDGKFSLEVSAESVLHVSYIGYETSKIVLSSNTNLNIRLKEDTKLLDEVVVVGYGTLQKKDLTGAVGVIRGDVIESRQSVQVSQALQGAVPGLTVTRSSGAPGATSTIRVRGITTLGDSEALVIIDGVPSDNINNVNPGDIESISVLKDAASASIYGSRAASGVILITTKRARTGQAQFTYNYEFGLESPTELPEYTDVVRYMQLVNERQFNDGGANLFDETFINDYWTNHMLNPDLYPATDWQGSIYKKYAPRERHDFALTMGTEKIKTKASFSYVDIDGLYSNSSYNRYMLRLNNDISIHKMLSANVDVSYKRSNNIAPAPNAVSGRTVAYAARIMPGIYDNLYEDGRYAEGKDGWNILADVNEGGTALSWYNQLTGRFVLDFKPIEGLSLKAVLAPTLDFNKFKTFAKVIEYTELDDPSRIISSNRPRASLSEQRADRITLNGQFLANYQKKIRNNNFNFLAGYEENQLNYETLSASREGFMIAYPYLDLGSEDFRDNAGSAYAVATKSFLGRIDYNYKHKYYLQLNARYDGSSRFHKDHRWAFFPSLSTGWVVTEEQFLSDFDFLPFLKLRGSWGRVGNERIGNYPYQASIAHYDALFYQAGQIVSVKTGAQTTYAVEDITWETTESYNVGMDAAFFNQKLSMSADYYRKNTRDILLELDIPLYLGYIAPYQNAGKMSARGWEFETTWKDKVGDLNYSVSFNISDVKTRIDDLKGTQLKGNQAKLEGGKFNEWYGYKSKGIYQTQEQIDNSARTNTSVTVGDVWYEDISGPDGIPDGEINDYDKVLLGGSLPRYTYGGNINLGYKGVDFSLSFNGVGKILSRLSSVQVQPFMEGGIGNVPKIIDGKFWSSYNSEAQNINAVYPRLSTVTASNNYTMSDFWLIDGSYFRIKNITLGYTIPLSRQIKNYIQKFRLYVAVNDPVSLNKYPKGWDPESTATGYPIVMTFMSGLNITF